MFSLRGLPFVLSSRDFDVLRAQRIMGFFILITHKSTRSENPICTCKCLNLLHEHSHLLGKFRKLLLLLDRSLRYVRPLGQQLLRDIQLAKDLGSHSLNDAHILCQTEEGRKTIPAQVSEAVGTKLDYEHIWN